MVAKKFHLGPSLRTSVRAILGFAFPTIFHDGGPEVIQRTVLGI